MTVTSPPIAPIRRTISVSWGPEEAFERFTARFGEWWPRKTHSIGGKKVRTIGFECRVGGQIYEELDDGRCFQWGRVTEWDPPRTVGFIWHPSRDESTAQHVSIRFLPEGTGTQVDLISTGWEKLGARAAKERKSYDAGWGTVLAAFGGRFSALTAVFRVVQAFRTGWLRLTGRLDAAIDACGGKIPAKSVRTG